MAYFKAGGDRQPQARGDFRKFQYALRRLAAENLLPGFRLDVDMGRRILGIERSGPQAKIAPSPAIVLPISLIDKPSCSIAIEPIKLDFDG